MAPIPFTDSPTHIYSPLSYHEWVGLIPFHNLRSVLLCSIIAECGWQGCLLETPPPSNQQLMNLGKITGLEGPLIWQQMLAWQTAELSTGV